jgi:hypothetical protein
MIGYCLTSFSQRVMLLMMYRFGIRAAIHATCVSRDEFQHINTSVDREGTNSREIGANEGRREKDIDLVLINCNPMKTPDNDTCMY